MISFLEKCVKRESWHPSIEELLLSIDGEIRAAADPKVKAHLRMCWSCRARQERIAQAISDFVKHRELLRTARPGLSSRFVERFEARLDLLEREKGRPSLLAGLMASVWQQLPPWRLSWKHAVFLVACSVMIAAVLRLSVAPPVSARELLERVEQAEAARIRTVDRPVVYQKLRVKRHSNQRGLDAAVNWEIWSDVRGRRSSARVEGDRLLQRPGGRRYPSGPIGREEALPSVLVELDQVLRSNHMQEFNPLSATSYRSWRKSVRPERETVTQGSLDDAKTLILTTTARGPFGPNAVIQASLLVRADDWHPIEQQLKVQGENETRDFTVTETALQVVALSKLPASIFSDLAPEPAFPAIVLPPVSIAPPVIPPTAIELITTEIDVLHALHRVKACLRETIQVESVPAKWVEVRALAETAERKEELRQALRDLKFVKLNIRDAAPPPHEKAGSPDQKEPESPFRESQAPRIPAQPVLQSYFADKGEPLQTDGRIAEFSNQALSFSQAALAEATALRRLVEWHSSGKTKELNPESAWLLEVMVREHLAGLKYAATLCRELLDPVLPFLISQSALHPPESVATLFEPADVQPFSWTARSTSLIALVERIHDLVYCLFASYCEGTELTPKRTGEAGRELASALSQLEGSFVNVHTGLAKEFTGQENLLSSRQDRQE